MSLRSFLRAVGRVARAHDGRVGIVATLAIVLLLLQSGIGHSLLQATGVARPSPSFAELYFPDARAIPTTLPKSNRLDLHFAVGNSSTTSRILAWQVGETRGSSQLVLGSGRSLVAAHRTKMVAYRVRVQCSSAGRAQLDVTIVGSSTRITLWLACRSPR